MVLCEPCFRAVWRRKAALGVMVAVVLLTRYATTVKLSTPSMSVQLFIDQDSALDKLGSSAITSIPANDTRVMLNATIESMPRPINTSTPAASSSLLCTAPLVGVRDQPGEPQMFQNLSLRHHGVPQVIYMTSKSRCMTEPYERNVNKWRWPGYALEIHDDDAVNRLFARNWTKYLPLFRQAIQCLPREGESSPAKADVWRYLVLWDRGGIYTDFDNAPGKRLGSTLDLTLRTADAFIPLNHKAKLGQSFIAISPRHPLMLLCLRLAVKRLLACGNLAELRTWSVTGPAVLDSAFAEFVGRDVSPDREGTYNMSPALVKSLQESFPGDTWMFNRSIHVVGAKETYLEYVQTSVLRRKEKEKMYNLTGMIKWQHQRAHHSELSCRQWLVQKNISIES